MAKSTIPQATALALEHLAARAAVSGANPSRFLGVPPLDPRADQLLHHIRAIAGSEATLTELGHALAVSSAEALETGKMSWGFEGAFVRYLLDFSKSSLTVHWDRAVRPELIAFTAERLVRMEVSEADDEEIALTARLLGDIWESTVTLTAKAIRRFDNLWDLIQPAQRNLRVLSLSLTTASGTHLFGSATDEYGDATSGVTVQSDPETGWTNAARAFEIGTGAEFLPGLSTVDEAFASCSLLTPSLF
jgi:hypothetical protein